MELLYDLDNPIISSGIIFISVGIVLVLLARWDKRHEWNDRTRDVWWRDLMLTLSILVGIAYPPAQNGLLLFGLVLMARIVWKRYPDMHVNTRGNDR